MSEPTSALSYGDLVLNVAEMLGVAYYGPNGNLAAAVPVDAFTLDRVTRYCNDGIRMFIADAPPAGWRWQRPLAEIDLWPDKGVSMPSSSSAAQVVSGVWDGTRTVATTSAAWFDANSVGKLLAVRGIGVFTIAAFVSPTVVWLTNGLNFAWPGNMTFNLQDPTGLPVLPTLTIAYNGGVTNTSTVTATVPGTFYPSSVNKPIYVTDLTGGPLTIVSYVSDQVVLVTDTGGARATAWGAGARTYSLTAFGVYSMPQNFGGEYSGEITYVAGSNRGVPINWITELEIRRLRENWNMVSGNPYYAAIRRAAEGQNRRWELLIYPNTGGMYTVEFPYIIYFDKISSLTDVHPAGMQHDETVKAACLAAAEMQGEDQLAGRVNYYRSIALPNSYKIDARSAPRKLGYCGNQRSTTVALKDFRQYFRRPSVTYRS